MSLYHYIIKSYNQYILLIIYKEAFIPLDFTILKLNNIVIADCICKLSKLYITYKH